MFLRVISVIAICAGAVPLSAAERPMPTTRPSIAPGAAPSIVRPAPAFRVAPSDLPRASLVRPDTLRPLPSDARPIMPILPRPAPGTRPIGVVRPLPAPIERPVRPLPRPAN